MYDDITTGARVRALRKWRGLTLEELGGLAGFSKSFLSMAERGQRALDKRSHISALATALRVSETDIVNGPHLSADELQSGPHAAIRALRLALTSAELGDSSVNQARPIIELADLVNGPVERAWRLNDYARLGGLLPALIDELHYHVAAPADEPTLRLALETLLDASITAAHLTQNLHHYDLNYIAAARGAEAAARLGDPVARGKAMFSFARSDGGSWERAVRRAEAEVARLQPHVTDPESKQVLGMLMLDAGMANAANRNPDAARAWLNEAADLAEHVEDDIDNNWESFSATNVRVWRVKIGVELGEAGAKMLELSNYHGRSLDVADLDSHPARKANFLTETGVGLARERRTRERAVRWLLRAEKAGPQRFLNNVRARSAVEVLLSKPLSASAAREVRGMAARMGVPH